MANSILRKLFLAPITLILLSGVGLLSAENAEPSVKSDSKTLVQVDFMLPWVPTLKAFRDEEASSSAVAHPSRVQEILHEVLMAIYDGHYELAVNKCEETLKIDSSNAVAMGRMGSAFYLNGDQHKAILLWRRALEFEPDNQLAINLLRKLEDVKQSNPH